jgi:hypothetical protein
MGGTLLVLRNRACREALGFAPSLFSRLQKYAERVLLPYYPPGPAAVTEGISRNWSGGSSETSKGSNDYAESQTFCNQHFPPVYVARATSSSASESPARYERSVLPRLTVTGHGLTTTVVG